MRLFFETAGSGPALVILHGLFGSSDNWRTVAKPLAEHFTVYFVDQRNHGRSPHDPRHDYLSMAADLLELLDSEGIPQATLLGHSMGGKTVMQAAFEQPHRVEKLIVADMGMKAYRPHHNDIIRALRSVPVDTLESRQQAEQLLAENGIPEAGVRQFLLKSLYRPETGGFAWRFNLEGLVAAYDSIILGVGQSGDSYDGPTLFVRGARSNYVRDEDVPAIRQHFPNFQLDTIPNAGHWVHAEQPRLFLESIAQFLGVSV